MAPEIIQALLGRRPKTWQHAKLHGYIRYPVKQQVYPGLLKQLAYNDDDATSAAATTTLGVLYQDITESEMKILDWYEDEAYTRIDVDVRVQFCNTDTSTATDDDDIKGPISDDCSTTTIASQTYLWTNPTSELDLSRGEWSYRHFLDNDFDHYYHTIVQPCVEELHRQR